MRRQNRTSLNLKSKSIRGDGIRRIALEKMHSPYIPSSVYRLQFNHQFTFNQARMLIPYFKKLGIDALYCSPYFQSVSGSLHGYDVTDPNQINPEIGTAEDYEQFCRSLQENNMAQIVDVVPNHMGIKGNGNKWWMDILENGRASPASDAYDIDWEPVKPELRGKILIPILGDLYGRVLEKQEIKLRFSNGEFRVQYHDHRLPVDPGTYPMVLGSGLDELKKRLGRGRRPLKEYLAVVASFKRLLPTTHREPTLMQERRRRKEEAKRRLSELIKRSAAISEFIRGRLRLFNGRIGDPKSFDLLDRLLNKQPYRMAHWRVAAEEINYRRFFDVNELAAIRIEDDRVFEDYHELLFKLIGEGRIKGLRVDHPDGLYDPPAYLRKLQRECLVRLVMKEEAGRARRGRSEKSRRLSQIRCLVQKVLDEYPGAKPFFIVAEKILDRREPLPENWNVHGTVGYDFLNALNGLFIRRDQEKEFEDFYTRYIGQNIDFDDLVYNAKKFFALVRMASEMNDLGHRLDLISERDRNYRDFTRNNLTLAIREVIACFPVYRSYISTGGDAVLQRDEKYVHLAVEKAKRKTPALNPAVYDFLRDVLLLKLSTKKPEERKLYRDFVLRFQQLTGPVMAKGLEDTSFYIYNRFLSLNEVGGDPFFFGYSRDDFHRQNIQRHKRWPAGMTASSTHDTKRSEDVRMRLNVLSELAGEWRQRVSKWSEINEKHRTGLNGGLEPDRNTEYFIYQTLVGVWPDNDLADGGAAALVERLWQCFLKSVREAKIRTNWVSPNAEYEEAVRKFVVGITAAGEGNAFLRDFLPFQRKIMRFGKFNSLSALVLKIGSPGVVDTYQGTELWDYSLVDPDNRRAVDFRKRRDSLKFLVKKNQESLRGWMKERLGNDRDGFVKLFLLWKGLNFRKKRPELFIEGDYVPLAVEGLRERHAVAFLRKKGDSFAVIVGGRFFAQLISDSELPIGEGVWQDTRVLLPPDFPKDARSLREVFSEREVAVGARADERFLRLSDVLQSLSVSILTNKP